MRCMKCGQFISLFDILSKKAKYSLETPDAHMTKETWDILCPRCYKEEKIEIALKLENIPEPTEEQMLQELIKKKLDRLPAISPRRIMNMNSGEEMNRFVHLLITGKEPVNFGYADEITDLECPNCKTRLRSIDNPAMKSLVPLYSTCGNEMLKVWNAIAGEMDLVFDTAKDFNIDPPIYTCHNEEIVYNGKDRMKGPIWTTRLSFRETKYISSLGDLILAETQAEALCKAAMIISLVKAVNTLLEIICLYNTI